MQIFYGIDGYPKTTNSVVTTGTFDGVHLGHKKVLDTVVSEALNKGGPGVVITFLNHPRIVLNKDAVNLNFLNTLEEKISLIADCGIDRLLILPFDKEFAKQSAEQYISKYIKGILCSDLMIIGYDHHIGKERQANKSDIENVAALYGISTIVVPPAFISGQAVSSTRIRNALKKGDIKQANSCLGYNYFFNGKVVNGNHIGEKLGFPTANLLVEDKLKLIPGEGVYAVTVNLNSNIYKAMMNIGNRPTINKNTESNTIIEVHIFDFNNYIYNDKIRVNVIEKIRNEIKFNGLDELKSRLEIDKSIALKILSSL